uniref:C40 family peptidase n=2 Tax=Hydrogenophaga sp. OTU3427 TaxID=3043856 RepID=UPI00313E0F54
MQKTALLLTLSLALTYFGTAHAQTVAADPTNVATPSLDPSASDALADLLVSKGLVQRLEGMRQQMSLRASDLVVTAMGFLGVPYRRGGNSVETGFDCSGFVRAMYEQTVGLVLPRRAAEQAQATETISRDELKPGDLVFFNTMRHAFSHVGIYVGDGKFIHSPRSGAQVRVEDMRTAYWHTRFNGARRVTTARGAGDGWQAAQ